jgi:hypothetical protein
MFIYVLKEVTAPIFRVDLLKIARLQKLFWLAECIVLRSHCREVPLLDSGLQFVLSA